MDLVVEVRDAADAALPNATVVLKTTTGTTQGTSDAKGRFNFGPMPTQAFTVEVSRASYLDEQVEVTPVGAGSIWSNPVCTVTPSALVVRLSRLRAAPTAPISNPELEAKAAYDPMAVFTWIDKGGNRTDRYLAVSDDRIDEFHIAKSPMLPSTAGDGWGRLNHEKRAGVDPGRDGDLVWLEWGLGKPEPRLSVAAWLPRFRGATPSTLDIVIFISPTTDKPGQYEPDRYPWLGKYPYWARRVKDRPDPGREGLWQSYPGLAYTYLFRGKWLAHQLLAAGRQAVVLCPVQPWGVWGPFDQVAGLSRLVAEVTHFMHRTGHTAGGQMEQGPGKAPRANFRQGANRYHQPPPPVGRIVLSGFSAGMLTVVDMLGAVVGDRLVFRPRARPAPTTEKERKEADEERKLAEEMSKGMPHALFGADPAPFLSAWKEVWDCDAEDGARRSMDTALPAWMKKDTARMARCYQTTYTGSQNWLEKSPLTTFAPGPTLSGPAGLPEARERHSGRCSLVYWGAGYLDHSSTKAEIPAFWSAGNMHHSVPMVAFGHAAGLSGLAKR